MMIASATSASARATLPQRTRACSGGGRSASMPGLGTGGKDSPPGRYHPPPAFGPDSMPVIDPLYDLVLMLDSAAPDE